MALNEQELLDLKEQVNAAKTTVSELTGQQTALLRQLKEEWGCKTIKEAEGKLEKMKKDITIFDNKIEKSTAELEELLNTKNNE